MAADSRRVTVTTNATRLDSTSESDRRAGKSFSMYVDAATSVTVFIGGADVDVSQGSPVTGGQWFACDLDDDEAVYGRVASGSAVVRVFETGL